jgi:photosystem II stability/assembly factor-like uncharacterized protein
MKIKSLIVILSVTLLSASCNIGGKNIVAGTVHTVNGGADWQFANAIVGSKSNINSLNVSKLSFDPHDRQEVFVGGYNGGLYKWDNNNSGWKEILSNILVYDFAISPVDSKTIYAAGLFNEHGRLLITKDGGSTWTQIFNDASQNNAVRSVVLNPTNPSQIVIGLGSGSVIKSADGGLSWQLAKDFSDRVNRMVWQGNNLYVLLQSKGLLQSTDFATTFNLLSSTLGITGNTNDSTGSGSSGLTYNQFFVDTVSPSLIYITTSQGLYKTIDGGKMWSTIPLPTQNGDGQTRAVAIANNSSNLVFTSIGSTIYKSTDGGLTWQTQKVATNGIINYILIDPQLPQMAWAGIFGQ